MGLAQLRARLGPEARRSVGISLWIGMLAILGVLTGGVSQHLRPVPDPTADVTQWGLIAIALTVAGSLSVEIRHRGEVEALDVFEVALAPAIYLLSGPEVALLAAAAKALSQIVLRMPFTKLVFNTVQWAACAGAGSLCFAILAGRGHPVAGLVAAMFVVLVTNLFALVGLFAVLDGLAGVRQLLSPRSLQWSVSLTVVTTAAGLGVATTAIANPNALLFVIALPVLLYWAGRGYTISQADLARARSLQAGTRALSAVHDFRTDPEPFLLEVARSCQADGAELALRRGGGEGFETYRYHASARCTDRDLKGALTRALLASPLPIHGVAQPRAGVTALTEAVRAAGWRDCLAVPVVIEGQEMGVLAVFDRSGLADLQVGDLAALDAFGRELASALQRAKLVDQLVDARQDAARIVHSSTDGIMAIAAGGWVVTWNPGFTRLTGHRAQAILTEGGLAHLDARDVDGEPVALADWSGTEISGLPAEFSVRAADGRRRWLACSYAATKSDDGVGDLLVVVARDVTELRRRQELIIGQGGVLELIATDEPPAVSLAAVAELVGRQLDCVVGIISIRDDVGSLLEARWDGGRSGLEWNHEQERMIEVAEQVRTESGLVKGPGPYRALAVREGRKDEVRGAIVVRVPTLDQPDEHGVQVLRTAVRLAGVAIERHEHSKLEPGKDPPDGSFPGSSR